MSRQNGNHFPDDTFKYIFLNENIWISIKISLKFVPRGPINNIPALVQIMAWRWPGKKTLSEPMVVRLLTHICVGLNEWTHFHTQQTTCTADNFRSVNENFETIREYSNIQLSSVNYSNTDWQYKSMALQRTDIIITAIHIQRRSPSVTNLMHKKVKPFQKQTWWIL